MKVHTKHIILSLIMLGLLLLASHLEFEALEECNGVYFSSQEQTINQCGSE